MVSALIPLIGLMICGAVIALETKDLLSGIISLGIIGFVSIIISSLCLGMGVRSLKLKEF